MNMMKTIVVTALVFVVSLLASACGVSRPEVKFCDTQIEYSIWKQDNTSFLLNFEAGQVSKRACSPGFGGVRETRLSQFVSSKEEALKLVEEYRRKYVEKINTELASK